MDRRSVPALHLKSVRTRTTLASAGVVAIALGIGGIGFVILLRAGLTGSVQDVAQQRAETTAAALQGGSTPKELAPPGEEELFVQIIDLTDGTMLANSDPRLTSALPKIRPHRGRTLDHIPIADGNHSFWVVERDLTTPRGSVRVVAGASLEHVMESTRLVTRLLLYGIPGLLALVVLTTWLFIGRALHPVEAIRRQVSNISAQDLDERVRVPATRDEIAHLAQTMNEMLARLARSSLRQRHFISDASHELRSPIATIRHLAEIAQAHPESINLQELASAVFAEERRLESLVDDLLLLTRADEHTLANLRQPIDLDDLVFEEAARLKAASSLRVDTSKVSAARIEGDLASLRRALRNLADNAMRHAESRVTFELSSDGETATVVVADDGEGIQEEDRERIFERFTRLEAARDRDSGGSGLGLSIVNEIMKAHNGQVHIGGGPGCGARFELQLPAVEVAP